MPEVVAKDHAFPASSNAPTGIPVGMTSEEKDVIGGILRKDKAQGAAVHAFDPNATPEQKAAAAGAARAQLAAIPGVQRPSEKRAGEGRAVVVDTSTANSGDIPKPTVTLDDVDKASRGEGEIMGAASVPGSIPAGAAPAVPTWMETGWRQVAGLDAATVRDPELLEQSNIMAAYLSEQMYGAWYHNAAIIIFAVLMTRTMTQLNFGWGWILIVLASCASYYSLSITRTRQRARDDIQRELVKTRLVTETESADWLNGFLDRFWLIYEPVLSQTIVASVDAVLASSTPAFLESIRLTTFTLGTKAPRIDFVRTFPKTPEDIVIMDWAISFTPNDLMDITPRQAQNRVNPKVVLSIRVGKGGISKNLPILLEDMSFSGKMRIKLKLMTNFPHVQTIDLSFIEKPTFDYVLKPLGGETFGFDINNIPGLAPFIRDQVHANLGPMMYDPNVFTIDLQALLSGTPLDAAIGVLKIHISDARGLKAVKLGGGLPDPYVSIALGGKPAMTKTQTIPATAHPTWNETQFILVNTLADVLNLSLYDYNEHRADNLLGTVSHELAGLNDDAEQEALVGKILGGGKERGELRYDLSYFPVLKPVKNPDGTFEPLPDTQTGIVRLTLHQAKDLDVTKGSGELSPFAKVYLGGSKHAVHKTPTMKHQNQPVWESYFEFMVPEKQISTVTIQITNSKEFAIDPALGTITISLTDLLESMQRQQDWFPLKGSRAGKIRLTAEWKPVAMSGSMSGAAVYVPPIGILRIWLKRASDVKNVEATLGGKSDPYVRVLGSNKILARTEVINNNLNPEWDQIVYVPVHNLKESLILELMDYQHIGKDRTLGTVELRVSECAESNNDSRYPFKSKGHQIRDDKIRLDKANTYKGTLHFEVDFKPAMSLKGGVHFDAEKNELAEAAEEKAATAQKAGESMTSLIPLPTSTTLNGGGGTPSLSTPGMSVNGDRKASVVPAMGHRQSASISTMQSMHSAKESAAGGEATAAEDPEVGVELSAEELMKYQSGVLVFQVVSGQLARRGTLEVMFDDGYWPSFSSTRARSNHQKWDQIGEGFVRELDFSRIWLRINAADDSEKEDVVAEFKCDTKEFLEQCLTSPADFLLSQGDGSNRSVITMSARFVPVDIKLEPRESINNMGVLRVDVISAKGLMAADRGGKSDPYVQFHLNGHKVFKSDTKKKTLAPVWNESFEVMIPSRVGAKFTFEINDWDRVGLPFYRVADGLVIARSRQKTSTFSTAGRAITQIGGVPVGVGKGVFHGGTAVASGIGHGLGAVGGFAGRRISLIKKKDKSGKEVLVPADEDIGNLNGNGNEDHTMETLLESPVEGYGATSAIDGNALGVSNAGRTPHPSVEGGGAGFNEPGILNVTVLRAKDLKSEEGNKVKPFVQLRMGGKSHKTGHVKGVEPEWNESFAFNSSPGSSTFTATVYEHHTLGKDIELGEAEIDFSRHLQPPSLQTAEISVELTKGSGLLTLRLDWTPGGASHGKNLVSGLSGRHRTPSISSNKGNSPAKFGLRMSRKDKDRDEE